MCNCIIWIYNLFHPSFIDYELIVYAPLCQLKTVRFTFLTLIGGVMVGKVVCFKVLLDKKEMTISEVVLQRFGGGEVGGGSMPN